MDEVTDARSAPGRAVPRRVATLNLASGRGGDGRPLTAAALAAAVRDVDVDVLSLQEVDAAQPRSHGVHQASVVAAALGAADWRFAPTLRGTPGPVRSWRPVRPAVLHGPATAGADGPLFGDALVSRVPVRRWHVLSLGAGRARLPIMAPDPRTGTPRWWWIPDEPRVALAAELPGLTVVATHLSFSPPTALRQLWRLRRWMAGLPAPVVLAGDLNLPGPVPGRVVGGQPLARALTYPGADPRLQLDHLLAVGPAAGSDPVSRGLDVGDHLLLAVTVGPG